jgi:WD40 repeat protein/tetratricopeptide (TPR) repeat protein
MANNERKSLGQLADESEKFEKGFERYLSGEGDESERAALIADMTAWLQAAIGQGRFFPLGSADRRALKSLLEYWNSRLRQQHLEVRGVDRLADFDSSAGVVLVAECPYPGLEPFSESRRTSFFGRDALVSSSVEHLEQQGNRALLIIGASGSGKSSLALAGILPRLTERHDGAWLFGPRLTPGAHPLAELAASVAQAIGHPEKRSEIARGLAAQPGEALGQLGELCRDKPLMLLIDQFEELLTMCRDAGEQSAFAQVLCALSDPAASVGGFCCRILLALRTDHLARFESNNALKPLHMRLVGVGNDCYLSAIGFSDIKRAIKEPAEQVGLRFAPAALIDQLASQTAGLANGLPLLQFALRRLWNTRPTNELGEPLDLITEEMVKALPDVERALGTVAEGLFRTFSALQQQICERLLLELVVLDESFEEPLRRRRNEAELSRVLQERFSSATDVARVIGDFAAAGLLCRFGEGPDSQLEVAHEALLRHWDHIYQLVTGAEVKERLHLIKQIGREAGEWAGRGRTDDYLSLRGERLHRGLAYAEDGWLAEAASREYVQACESRQAAERLIEQRAKEAERFRRYTWRLAVGAVFGLAIVLVWAWYTASEESFAQRLAMVAEGELDQDSSQRSLLLAVEAARHGKRREGGLLPGVERALRSAIRASSVRASIKSYGGTLIYAAAYTPDGSVLALGDSLGGITLWDIATGLQRKALFAHVDSVEAIAFSPDGRKMASGSSDGKVVVWDTESAKQLHILSGHLDQVTSLAFSRPDGRLLATASDDGSVRLWDVSEGTQVRTLYGHVGGVKALAFGRDERQLATAGDDNRVVVWDATRGRVLYSLPFRDVFDLDFSSDGSLLAVAIGDRVEIWDTATRARRSTLTGHTNSVLRVRFSRDARQVATASYDATVRVWRLARDDRDAQPPAHEMARFAQETIMFTSLAFSPTGDTVAATANDLAVGSGRARGVATVWNLAGGELLTLAGYESAVAAVVFSPDGKTITATGSTDGHVQTWDLSGKRVDTVFKNTQTGARAAAFSKNGVLAIGAGRDVLLGQPGASAPRRLPSEHKDSVNDLAFSPDGRRLVSGSDDGTAIVWELPSGKPLGSLAPEGQTGRVVAVAYSPDGEIIATGGEDKTIRLWRADTRKLLREIRGPLLGILDLAFTADSRKVVSGNQDKTVRIWDATTGAEEDVLRGHTGFVTGVAINGDHLATAADDGIRLWDLHSRAPVAVFPARGQGAQTLAFSPDGHYLAAGGSDGVVRVYAMQVEELVQLAENRVRRGWTSEECKQFLPGKSCPRSRYSVLDEANRRFEEFDLKGGEQLLREAKGSDAGNAKLINAEVDSRLGTALLWAASNVLAAPESWARMAEDKKPEEIAGAFLAAASAKSKDLVFDPRSRLNDLIAYQDVERARKLARANNLEESVAAFQKARGAGWNVPGEPVSVASRLFALAVLSKAYNTLSAGSDNSTDQIQNLTKLAERAVKLYPELGPGHWVLAQLYERQKDFEREEQQYLEASSTESSGEPLATLALSIADRDPGKAVRYARRALAEDASSAVAWKALGFAELQLNRERESALAFDHVPSSSEFFAQALNIAGSIYFEYLKDDATAYQRYTRAVELAPNDLKVVANYAEFLLASGRYDQAKLAAGRAREHADAQGPDMAYLRAAMSFVLFTAELLSGEHRTALAELDEIERQVKAASQSGAGSWSYKGIRRSLARLPGTGSPEQRKTLLKVLDFVESNGRKGTISDERAALGKDIGS